VHSPRLAAKASYRRKPVSRKADWIPCQVRNDGVRGEEDTPLLAAGYFIGLPATGFTLSFVACSVFPPPPKLCPEGGALYKTIDEQGGCRKNFLKYQIYGMLKQNLRFFPCMRKSSILILNDCPNVPPDVKSFSRGKGRAKSCWAGMGFLFSAQA